MNTIRSAEFRKQYPRLKEAVTVEANGHAIGLWIPFDADGYAPVRIEKDAIYAVQPPISRGMTQAERDAVLRRISKG